MIHENQLNLAHEVIDSTTKAKLVAAAQSSSTRYKYLATAHLSGEITVSPYDPIHLMGLSDNMSGVWVVLAVTHLFKKDLPYSLRVSIGSNDELLNIKPTGMVNDISKNVVEVTPVILSEDDTFLEYSEDMPDSYDLTATDTFIDFVNTEEGATPENYDPVEDYITNFVEEPDEPDPNIYNIAIPKLTSENNLFIWMDK